MKKFLTLILAMLLCVSCCVGLTACSCAGDDEVKIVAVDLSNEQYAYAVKKGDTQLLNSVNTFLVEKKSEIDAIFAKYTAEGVDLNQFGSSEIQTTPTDSPDELVVATNLDFPPFEYSNGNKIAGIDMEIAQLLADYLNKTLVIVHMDFLAVVTSVQELDTYDIGMAGLTITDERKEQVAFSDPYFGTTQVLITKANDNTFDDCKTASAVEAKLKSLKDDAAKCGGQKATTSQFYVQGSADLGFNGFSNLKFSGYTSPALAVQDMLNGKIAFVVVDKTTAQSLVNSFNG